MKWGIKTFCFCYALDPHIVLICSLKYFFTRNQTTTRKKRLWPHLPAQRKSLTKHTHFYPAYTQNQGPSNYYLYVEISQMGWQSTNTSCEGLWKLMYYLIQQLSEMVVYWCTTLPRNLDGGFLFHLTHGDGWCSFIAMRRVGVISWCEQILFLPRKAFTDKNLFGFFFFVFWHVMFSGLK